MNTDCIYSYLKEHLKSSRLRHTMGVVSEALKLCEVYGGDKDKAEIAALVHDSFKCESVQTLDKLAETIGLDRKYMGNPNLSHSKIAAAMLGKTFGIYDDEIISAVSYHTTGRSNMTLLDKIIYLADAIEEGRNYPGVDEIRKAAMTDLDKAVEMSLRHTVEYLTDTGAEVDRDTIDALEWIEKREK